MLKLKISKEVFHKLTPAVQELYGASGDSYALDVEAGQTEDVGALKRANTRLRGELSSANDARDSAESKFDAINTNTAVKNGDIETLTKQWEDKFSTKDTEHATEVASLRSHISTTTIDSIVSGIAGRNTGTKENAGLLDPHIRKLLSVDFTDDGPQILMAVDGGTVPLDVEKFEKTVVDNPAFAAIIVGNRASGGGASDNKKPGQTGGAFPTDTNGQNKGPLDLSTAAPVDLVKILAQK